jgi:hypothetical protein
MPCPWHTAHLPGTNPFLHTCYCSTYVLLLRYILYLPFAQSWQYYIPLTWALREKCMEGSWAVSVHGGAPCRHVGSSCGALQTSFLHPVHHHREYILNTDFFSKFSQQALGSKWNQYSLIRRAIFYSTTCMYIDWVGLAIPGCWW